MTSNITYINCPVCGYFPCADFGEESYMGTMCDGCSKECSPVWTIGGQVVTWAVYQVYQAEMTQEFEDMEYGRLANMAGAYA